MTIRALILLVCCSAVAACSADTSSPASAPAACVGCCPDPTLAPKCAGIGPSPYRCTLGTKPDGGGASFEDMTNARKCSFALDAPPDPYAEAWLCCP